MSYSLSRLSLLNFKSYAGEEQVIEFGDVLTIITGENGTGKSSIVDALRFVITGQNFDSSKRPEKRLFSSVHTPARFTKLELEMRSKDERRIITRRKEGGSTSSIVNEISGADGVKVKISGSDLKSEVGTLMGTTDPIIENVILPPQEKSQWPTADPKVYEYIFSTRFKKKAVEKVERKSGACDKAIKGLTENLLMEKDKIRTTSEDVARELETMMENRHLEEEIKKQRGIQARIAREIKELEREIRKVKEAKEKVSRLRFEAEKIQVELNPGDTANNLRRQLEQIKRDLAKVPNYHYPPTGANGRLVLENLAKAVETLRQNGILVSLDNVRQLTEKYDALARISRELESLNERIESIKREIGPVDLDTIESRDSIMREISEKEHRWMIIKKNPQYFQRRDKVAGISAEDLQKQIQELEGRKNELEKDLNEYKTLARSHERRRRQYRDPMFERILKDETLYEKTLTMFREKEESIVIEKVKSSLSALTLRVGTCPVCHSKIDPEKFEKEISSAEPISESEEANVKQTIRKLVSFKSVLDDHKALKEREKVIPIIQEEHRQIEKKLADLMRLLDIAKERDSLESKYPFLRHSSFDELGTLGKEIKALKQRVALVTKVEDLRVREASRDEILARNPDLSASTSTPRTILLNLELYSFHKASEIRQKKEQVEKKLEKLSVLEQLSKLDDPDKLDDTLTKLRDHLIELSKKKGSVDMLIQNRTDVFEENKRVIRAISKKYGNKSLESVLSEANARAKELYYRIVANKLMAQDLAAYGMSVRNAIDEFSKAKVQAVNETLDLLWSKVYNGRDISSIRIFRKVKEPKKATSSLKRTKKVSYSLKISYEKTEDEDKYTEVKKIVSAGQQGLISIVVRIAVSLEMARGCGFFTLDEPTTNLDKEHIHRVADLLVYLLVEKRVRKQLIVITHNEEFAEKLENDLQVDREIAGIRKIHVEKDAQGHSVISSGRERSIRI